MLTWAKIRNCRFMKQRGRGTNTRVLSLSRLVHPNILKDVYKIQLILPKKKNVQESNNSYKSKPFYNSFECKCTLIIPQTGRATDDI